jgi:hypothetical protein
MTSKMKAALPWWLTLIVVIEALPMFLSPVVAFSLPRILGGPGAEEINQAAFIYAARDMVFSHDDIVKVSKQVRLDR